MGNNNAKPSANMDATPASSSGPSVEDQAMDIPIAPMPVQGEYQEIVQAAVLISRQQEEAVDRSVTALRIDCGDPGSFVLPPVNLLRSHPSLRLLELAATGPADAEKETSLTYLVCTQDVDHDGGIAFTDMLAATIRSRLMCSVDSRVSCFDAQARVPAGASPQGVDAGDIPPDRAAFVRTLLPAWPLGPAENACVLHVIVQGLPLWRALRAEASFLAALQAAGAQLHLVAHELVPQEAAGELEGLHGVSVYLPPDQDARRDLMPVVGATLHAFCAARSLRHAWLLFSRQMVWTPPLAEMLEEAGALPWHAGVRVWLNCHHRWVRQPVEEDYDEAALCFTRVRAMDAADAREVHAALSGDMFARRPDEMCSLYEGAHGAAAAAAEEDSEIEEDSEGEE